MIYLIGEIVLYLLAALVVGVAAGWLLRDCWAEPSRAAEASLMPGPGAFAAVPESADRQVRQLEAELVDARARTAELEARAEARVQEVGSLTRRLAGAERRMQELERERALQNRALQVLHQQLEFAIERRAAAPARTSGAAG